MYSMENCWICELFEWNVYDRKFVTFIPICFLFFGNIFSHRKHHECPCPVKYVTRRNNGLNHVQNIRFMQKVSECVYKAQQTAIKIVQQFVWRSCWAINCASFLQHKLEIGPYSAGWIVRFVLFRKLIKIVILVIAWRRIHWTDRDLFVLFFYLFHHYHYLISI